MKLLTKEIADRLPPLYSQEERGDEAIAQVKFFTPWTSWTWYASEYDPVERLCFGVVVGHARAGPHSVRVLTATRSRGTAASYPRVSRVPRAGCE